MLKLSYHRGMYGKLYCAHVVHHEYELPIVDVGYKVIIVAFMYVRYSELPVL